MAFLNIAPALGTEATFRTAHEPDQREDHKTTEADPEH